MNGRTEIRFCFLFLSKAGLRRERQRKDVLSISKALRSRCTTRSAMRCMMMNGTGAAHHEVMACDGALIKRLASLPWFSFSNSPIDVRNSEQ